MFQLVYSGILESMIPREHRVLLVLLAALGVVSLFVLWPFAITLAFGAGAAVALYPAFTFLHKRARLPAALAAFVTVLIVLSVLLAAAYFVGTQVAGEAFGLYRSLSAGEGMRWFQELPTSLAPYLPQISYVSTALQQAAASAAGYISNTALSIFTGALDTLFLLILFALSLFYFLKDGARWANALVEISPLPSTIDRRILDRLASAVNGILRGRLIIALVQGLVFALGLWLFRVPNPVLWGLIAGIVSIVPPMGTALVWIPVAAYLVLVGSPLAALGFVLWANGFGLFIDNIVSPVFLGKHVGLPPIAMLFGALGGLAVFGPAGILIGPVILSLFVAVLSIYLESRKVP
jgi:predicted PurR-regulated permease PerM